jgi:pyrroloquinoline quinone (PQQ) biosynthesis protein C
MTVRTEGGEPAGADLVTLDARSHHRHPFTVRIQEGALTPDELPRWIRNRFHYQQAIPFKDALILASLPSVEKLVAGWRGS